MSAPTAKAKKPEKKAEARTVAERRAGNQSRFDEYRERARNLKTSATPPSAPYVVKAAELDDGIDADVVLVPPTRLADRTALDRAVRSSDLVSIIIILGGEITLNRMVAAFDRVAEDTGEDATRLFAAFGYSVVNHLNGAGAAEAPGGSTAS